MAEVDFFFFPTFVLLNSSWVFFFFTGAQSLRFLAWSLFLLTFQVFLFTSAAKKKKKSEFQGINSLVLIIVGSYNVAGLGGGLL